MQLPDLSKIIGKGEPIPIIGGTGHGKSTVINSLIDQTDDGTIELANLRIANGKGTVESTDILLTNHPSVPKSSIVINGKFKNVSEKTVFDDNEMLVSILYLSTKDYYNAVNKNNVDPNEAYERGLNSYLFEKIGSNKDNTSLSYRLRNIYAQEIATIGKSLYKFNPETLNRVFVEMKSKNATSSKDEIDIFKTMLLEYSHSIPELDEAIKGFWSAITDIFNSMCVDYLNKIDEFNAVKGYEYKRKDSDKSFELVIDKNDKDTEIVQILLNSEDRATEFLTENFTICINIDFNKFNCDLNYFHVINENGNNYYAIRLIDTMGLFHKDGTKIRDEKERIVDICSKTHCSNVIFAVKAGKDAIVKDSLDAFVDFVKNSKKNINIFIVYTHFDEYLSSLMNPSNNQFKRRSVKDKGQVFDSAEVGIKQIYEEFVFDSNNSNINSSKKPILLGYTISSYWTYDDEINNLIESKGYDYTNATINLIRKIANNNSKQKFVIHKVPDKPYVIAFNEKNSLNVKDIYTNIIFNKDLCNNMYTSVHWKTAESAIESWCSYGDKFISEAKGRETGYSKIETNFVEYIRNFVSTLVLKNLGVIDTGWKIDSIDDEDRDFIGELYIYLKNNLGRNVAKILGNTIYNNIKFSYYHTSMFRDMISNLQLDYFMYPDIKISEQSKLYQVLALGLHKTINDFIDCKCIEVY